MDAVAAEPDVNAASGTVATEAPPDAPETDAPTSAPPTVGARLRRWDPVVLVAAALVLVPTVAAMVSSLRNPWVPTDDWARLELQVRAVGTADTPLVGAWSRFGWDHPGPWPLYLLAAFYRLVPAEHGLLFGAAAVNLLAVAGCVALALRRPRSQALVLLVGLAVLQRGLGIAALADPWNPLQPILPFALYCLVCVELALGPRPWMVALAAGCASFAVQAHVGFAQPVIIVGLTAAGLAWWSSRGRSGPATGRTGSWRTWRTWRGWDRRRAGRAALPTAIVLLVAWAPVALDQLAGSGNAGKLVRWAAGAEVAPGMGQLTEGRLSPGEVARSAAWLLDPAGPWVGNDDHVVAFGFELLGTRPPALLLWLPVALVAAVVLATRVGAPTHRRPTVVAAAIAAAGVVATLTDLVSARGLPVRWPFRWVAVVAMLVWVAAGWAATGAVAAIAGRGASWSRRRSAFRRAGAGALLVLVVLPVAVTLWRGSLGRQPVERASDELVRLAPAILDHARDQDVVVANSTVMLGAVDLGLPVLLARAGIPWVEHDDQRAEGRDRLTIVPADDLDGLLSIPIATGQVEVLARSRAPEGEPSPGELALLRVQPDPGGPSARRR